MKQKVWLGLMFLIAFAYLLAHQNLDQTLGIERIMNDIDTSKRLYPPEHSFLENTIASMEAAFQAGADIVEYIHHSSEAAK